MNAINARNGETHRNGAHVEAMARTVAQQYGSPAAARLALSPVRLDAAFAEFGGAPDPATVALRTDAADVSGGMFVTRELDGRLGEILRETFKAPNGFRLFTIDTSVPAGARTYSVQRIYEAGDAAVYRAGTPIPRVTASKRESIRPIRTYVDGFALSVLDLASAAMAGFAAESELLRIARDVIMRFANRATWFGLPESDVWGILNYPWLPKFVSATAFTNSNIASNPDLALRELNKIANLPSDLSGDAMSPNVIVFTPRVYDALTSTPRSATTDTSVLAYFLANNRHIDRAEAAWELREAGPGGTDGILVYRDDRLGVTNVVPQPFTALPAERRGMDVEINCYMRHGGIRMREVGHNCLAWVEAGD